LVPGTFFGTKVINNPKMSSGRGVFRVLFKAYTGKALVSIPETRYQFIFESKNYPFM
jgi:hypothetical protein